MAGILRSSLIDMVVAVGLDAQTGLMASREQPPHPPNHSKPLFHTAFKPDVLAGISANVAHFPFNKNKQDIHYPPNFGKNKVKINREGRVRSVAGTIKKTSTHSLQRILGRNKAEDAGKDAGTECNGVQEHSGLDDSLDSIEYEPHPPSEPLNTPSLQRRPTMRNRSFRPADFARKNSRTDRMEMKPTDLPMELSQLESLVTLCFPDGAYVSASPAPTSVLYLVLTDLSGTKSYATSLIYYLPHTATQVGEDCWDLSEGANQGEGEVCYTPIAIALISKQPYFLLLRACASSIVQRLQQNKHEEFQQILKESALQLCSVSVPPPGCLGIEFTFNQIQLRLIPAVFPGQLVVNIQSNLLFQLLPREVILKVIGCLLIQQSVVFLASNYALLTTVIQTFLQLLAPFVWEYTYVSYILCFGLQTFLQLLAPFVWEYTYVPVLPWCLLELLEAPGTFLMGCHVRHKQYIQEIESVVLVDIEQGEMERCGPMFIPALPQAPVDALNASLRHIQPNMQLWKMARPNSFTYEESAAEEAEYYSTFNQQVFPAFLQLMVDLFRGVLPHIKPEKNFFNRDKFLESVPEIDVTFYEQVLKTDMFSTFVKSRLAQKNDAWSAVEERTRPVPLKRQSMYSSISLDFSRPLSEIDPVLSRSQSSPDLDLLLTRSSVELTYFPLPGFVYALNHVYHESCVADIKAKLKVLERKGTLEYAGHLFLLAQYKAAAGHKFDALETFQMLAELQPSLCPDSDIADIIAGMSDSEQQTLRQKEFYRRSCIWGQVDEKKSHQTTVIMAFDRLPKKDMDLQSFSEMVQVLDITKNHDAITNLFKALTLEIPAGDGPVVVSTGVFEEFYRCWKEVEMACRDIRLPATGSGNPELVLKMSDSVKCTYGMGRIGLTQERLFFLREGSKKAKDIALFVDVKSVEKVAQKTIFTGPTQDLKIISKGDNPKDERRFQASLREVRDLWYVGVQEMWAGQCEAASSDDPDTPALAAHHVLLLEAYARCLETESENSFLDLTRGAEHICSFWKRRERGTMPRPLPPPPATPLSGAAGAGAGRKSELHRRVDPNVPLAGDPRGGGGDHDRQTVLALCYTPGNRGTDSTVVERHPRLWCGLGGRKAGRLVVMDAMTWDTPAKVLDAGDRVVCVLAVGKSMIWAGSFDCRIYVVDAATQRLSRTLDRHTHHVTGLAKTQFESEDEPSDKGTVYSCSLNGDVYQWCVSSLACLKHFSLPSTTDLRLLSFANNLLWCGTRREVVVFAAGKEVRRVAYTEDLVNPTTQAAEKFELDCFLVTPDNELWVGCRTRGIILIFDADTAELIDNACITCKGISTMTQVKEQIWVGTKDGGISVLDQSSRKLLRSLRDPHTDTIRSMCAAAGERYVVTGAGSLDGTVAIWDVDSI